MRQVSTLILINLLSLSLHGQNWKVTSSYSLGLPRQEMKENIPPAHSLQAGLMYQLPGPLKLLSLGFELGIGNYSTQRIVQTFQFNNNVAAVLPVDYSSNVFNANLQARLNLLCDESPVIPYIQGKGGIYSFFSNIHIEDPHDSDGCRALQQENIISDNTSYWSAGGGIQIDPSVFSKQITEDRVLIDFGVNTIRGGTIDYINTKRLMDAQMANSPDSKPLKVEFINASTQQIHEHTVAQVYTSSLRMLEFRLGLSVVIGK